MELQPEDTAEEQLHCYRHPDTPTRLRCSRCEVPICAGCATPASVGQHCPECMRDARRSAPRLRSALRAGAPAVFILLLLNVAVFMLQALWPGLTRELALFPPAIADGQYWRLLTPMFLHANVLHIGMNSIILYVYGQLVEHAYGTWRFTTVYVGAGLAGGAASYAFNECGILGVGASGAIFGVVGALLVFLYGRRTSTVAGPYLRGLLLFVGINLIFGFMVPAIDNFAHLGGLAGGAALGFGLDRAAHRRPSRALQAAIVVAVLAGAYALVAWRTATFSCV